MAKNKKRKNVKGKYKQRDLFRNFYTKILINAINRYKIDCFEAALTYADELYMEAMKCLKEIYKEEKVINLNDLIYLYQSQCDFVVYDMLDDMKIIVKKYIMPKLNSYLINTFKSMNVNLFDEIPESKINKISNDLEEQLIEALINFCEDYYKQAYDMYIDILFNEILSRGHSITNINVDSELINVECLNTLLDYCNKKNYKLEYNILNMICEVVPEEKEYLKYNYIDDYRELSNLAKSKGFDLIRCNGDHGIFKDNKGYVVVIPQGRRIGKGLSIKIQKNLDGIGIDKYWRDSEIV